VVATENPIYKQNELINLKVPCINNETYCSGIATCNITIMNSTDNVLVNNQAMTNSGNYFNYSFSQTNNAGTYKAQIVCNDADQNGYSLFDFKITANGKDNNTNTALPIISTIFIIIFLATFGFLLENKHPAIAIPLIIISFILLISLSIQVKMMLDLNANVEKINTQLTNQFSYIMWLVGALTMYVTIFAIIKFRDYMHKKKLMERGLL
jgi:RsiW-degrading membrane proteinase PrsW (M82 family)